MGSEMCIRDRRRASRRRPSTRLHRAPTVRRRRASRARRGPSTPRTRVARARTRRVCPPSRGARSRARVRRRGASRGVASLLGAANRQVRRRDATRRARADARTDAGDARATRGDDAGRRRRRAARKRRGRDAFRAATKSKARARAKARARRRALANVSDEEDMILSFFRTAHALWGTTSPWRTEETFANARRSARAATRGMDDARARHGRRARDASTRFC